MNNMQFDFEPKTLARTKDDITSHMAAADLVHSGRHADQMTLALETVRKYPRKTSRELAEIRGCDRYLFARRLPDLLRLGLVEKAGIRICSAGHKMATIWIATEPEAK